MRPLIDLEVVVDLDGLQRLYAEWDALAVLCGLPYMSPAWAMGWWRHLAPMDATARVVVIRDRGQVIGLAPFWLSDGRREAEQTMRAQIAARGRLTYRLPGSMISSAVCPLALPGREWQVAEAVGRALDAATPRPDIIALDGAPLASHWPTALRDTWPGRVRPSLHQYQVVRCPTVSLREGSFGTWLAGKSSNFRGQMRRLRRSFAGAGGEVRTSTEGTLAADVSTLVHMHAARWRERGESRLVTLGDRLADMLTSVGRQLVGEERFRLVVLEINGEPISAQLFLVVGRRIAFWNGGWCERFARYRPGLLGILSVIEDAFERHEQRLDLGPGVNPYKLRFADGTDAVASSVLAIPGRRMPVTSARIAPSLVRSAIRDSAERALEPHQVRRLSAVYRHIRRVDAWRRA
jgi:CelD/BcsL family acetyltransferase involved in cellulose biosynthesis